MKSIRLDDQWTFRRGFADSLGMLNGIPGTGVDLPHDGMIGTAVSPDAPAKSDSGYFKGHTPLFPPGSYELIIAHLYHMSIMLFDK